MDRHTYEARATRSRRQWLNGVMFHVADAAICAVVFSEDETAENLLDVSLNASPECDPSDISSEGEVPDNFASTTAASADLDHDAHYDSMWAARAVSEARWHHTPPALDSDNDTLSDTSSSGNEDEDEDITDAVSGTDEVFGTNNPAFPTNLTDGEGFLRLNSTRLEMKNLATPDDRSSATTHGLGRFSSTEDDPWSVYASNSLLFKDTCDDLALDQFIASIEGVNTASNAGTH